MSNIERLNNDVVELNRLVGLTNSESVKRILLTEADKLKQLIALEEKNSNKPDVVKPALQAKTLASSITKIVNYAWDQSDKFVKLYVTLTGVHTYQESNFHIEFDKKSLDFQAVSPDKKAYGLTIKSLLYEIIPSESYHKIKTDMVILYLKKASSKHWDYVTESEKKAKEHKTPKFDKDEDPGQSMMNLMKQMYEDGDDEMKRAIAKAWTEARDKNSTSELV